MNEQPGCGTWFGLMAVLILIVIALALAGVNFDALFGLPRGTCMGPCPPYWADSIIP